MKNNNILIEKFENKLNLTEKDYNDILNTLNDEKNKQYLKLISVDIPRTLSVEFRNQNPLFSSNLEEVLGVFAASNDGLGYVSGMSFIAKIILKMTSNDKIKTFIILRNIFENQSLKDLYRNQYETIINDFNKKFNEKIPLLFKHFEKNMIAPYYYLYTWLKSLLCFKFDENIGEYVFKLFLEKNDFSIYYNAILSILLAYENELLKKSQTEILTFLNNIKSVDFTNFTKNI